MNAVAGIAFAHGLAVVVDLKLVELVSDATIPSVWPSHLRCVPRIVTSPNHDPAPL